MTLPSVPSSIEKSTLNLWKKYNDLLSAEETSNINCPHFDIEKTRQLLYEYAGKGLVENLDPTFFSKTIPFIDIGDDKVRK